MGLKRVNVKTLHCDHVFQKSDHKRSNEKGYLPRQVGGISLQRVASLM